MSESSEGQTKKKDVTAPNKRQEQVRFLKLYTVSQFQFIPKR